MMEKMLLKSKMALYGDSGMKLAEYLGISRSTLAGKMNRYRGAEFTQTEIEKIICRYRLTPDETMKIFFAETVS